MQLDDPREERERREVLERDVHDCSYHMNDQFKPGS
jgi:hypothetical protein